MAKTTDRTLRTQVIYQIFTRNYNDGTFRAVEADLDRIQSLGVDIIYLLPIHPSGTIHRKGSMGSPYAIQDYRAVDPVQGTKEDIEHLAHAIHARGMKLMIDVVYNHTSPDSVLANTHPEWFYHKNDGSLGNRVGDWWDVVDLDYSNQELWRYQIDTLKQWAELVDGFRCDVASMVPVEFWIQARTEVESVRPGCIWLAESVEPEFIIYNRRNGVETATDSELYQAFDICYDHDCYPLQKKAMTRQLPLKDYLSSVNVQEGIYPENYIKLRFLENHDRPRAAAVIPDEYVRKSWTAWSYFVKGTVMVYAGQEFGVTKHPTLFDLDPVQFETGKDDSSFLRKLSDLRHHQLFSNSSFHAEETGTDVIYAEHIGRVGTEVEGQKAIGIFPVGNASQAVTAPLADGEYINAIDGTRFSVHERVVSDVHGPIILFLNQE
ncbi:MAG: alpha-amylase [Solobacterium sp.]|nr:alpha-amylase [Solobacterium sp.]